MNRIAAACGTFNAFGSISCMLIVKRIWIYFTWNLRYINSLSLSFTTPAWGLEILYTHMYKQNVCPRATQKNPP